MTKQQLAMCMRDWAEFGWVIFEDVEHVQTFQRLLEEMNVEFTIDYKETWFSVQKVRDTVREAETNAPKG